MKLAAFAGALTAALLAAGLALAAPKFPELSGRVVDAAKVLPASEEARLTDRLARLEADTGRQLVVATVPSLQGYEIEEYGYQLGRAWGLGEAKRDDGAILLVAPKERAVRIEVGYGLEGVLTDAVSSQIIQNDILPEFRQGDLAEGVESGAEAIETQLRLDPATAQAAAQGAAVKATKRAKGPGPDIGLIVFLLVLLFFVILPRLFGGRGRRRRRLGGAGWIAPLIVDAVVNSNRRGGFGGGGGWRGGGGFGGGGFSGGGGSFGGGGATGRW